VDGGHAQARPYGMLAPCPWGWQLAGGGREGTWRDVTDAGAVPAVPGLVLDLHLGTGRFGAVWRGVDLGTGEPVAVRVGRPAGGAEAVAREGALLRRLQHENVVRLRSVVDLAGDARSLVVDLVPGGSLAALVGRRGPLPPGEGATVAVGVARALQHLHAHGFVHGRLSAQDVLFDVHGRPVVADVGVDTLLAPAGAPPAPARYPSPADDVLALGELLRDALPEGARGPLADLVDACLAPDPAARPTPDRAAQLAQQAGPLLPVDLTAAPAPAAPAAPGWRPLPGRPAAPAPPPVRPAPATHLAHPVAAPPAPVRPPAPPPVSGPADNAAPDDDRPRVRRVAVVAGVVLVGAGLTVGALALALRTGGGPEPAAVAPARGTTPSPSPTVLSDVASVVGRLASARAAAFSSTSEAALGGVDAPGSAALAEDLAFVRRLRAAGVRLEGLRFAVGDVRVVAATGDAVTVEARVATSGYRQVHPGGTVARTVPAQAARRVQLTLVRAGGAWRVSSVV
jgi:hypothetical protein